MGRRREPRKDIQVPVRIFGTDSSGQVFSVKAVTVNISLQGVELSGVEPRLAINEIIGLSYGQNRVHCRVKWLGQPGTPKAGCVGLLNTSPEKPLWDFPLPSPIPDSHQPQIAQQRKHPRMKCSNSVEIHTQDAASFRAKTSDLSVGGDVRRSIRRRQHHVYRGRRCGHPACANRTACQGGHVAADPVVRDA